MIEAAGIQLIGISYDAPQVLKNFVERNKITFPLLSDPESRTIDDFQIRNASAKGKAEGIPYPGTYLLDKSGPIRSRLFLDAYLERHTTEALLMEAKSF